ncbi:hypothetical protein BH24ACT14_BH24ACT14_15580 [soil metagenome]
MQAAALHDVLAVLGVGPVCLVGHDYGVPVSVTLAHAHPAAVSALVLAAGNAFTDTPIPIPLNAVKLPVIGGLLGRLLMSGPSLRLMLRLVGAPHGGLDPKVYLGDPGQRRSIATIFSASLRDLSARYAAVERALPALRHPTVVLWGDRDPFFPLAQAERIAAAIPNARLHVEAGAGHFLPAERPAAFVVAVTHLHDKTTRTRTYRPRTPPIRRRR